MIKYLVWYLIVINILAGIVCVADKISAIRRKSRVPEKVLFLISFIGGSIFMYLTMLIIRHKTLHKRFMIGLPIIITVQIILAVFYLNNGG